MTCINAARYHVLVGAALQREELARQAGGCDENVQTHALESSEVISILVSPAVSHRPNWRSDILLNCCSVSSSPCIGHIARTSQYGGVYWAPCDALVHAVPHYDIRLNLASLPFTTFFTMPPADGNFAYPFPLQSTYTQRAPHLQRQMKGRMAQILIFTIAAEMLRTPVVTILSLSPSQTTLLPLTPE